MRALLIVLGLLVAAAARAGGIPAIAYHDIVDAPNGDPHAITLADFERQMAYLVRSGYTPVSLAFLDEVRAGRAALPARPVLLTFDDGLRSYYTHAFPVLERHGFPSVLSVVTAWIDRRSQPEGYRTELLGWEELRELARSPLVEILSHSDDLHHGLPGNPWGSLIPAGIVRRYQPDTGAYETETERRARVRADLARSAARLRAELGIVPRGIAWPYGQYDGALLAEAAALGMAYHLTLDIEPNRLETLPRINRVTFRRYRALYELGDALTAKAYRRRQLRFVQVDLDAFAGKNKAEQQELVSRLLERLQLLRANAVILRPVTADGRRAFFPNGVLPAEADLLSYVAHQMVSRTGISRVYLRLPAGLERFPADFFADLGRHNRFSGLILDSADAGTLAAVRAALAPYRPGLKLVSAGSPVPGADYALVEIGRSAAPGAVARLARERLAQGETLFLLEAAGQEEGAATLSAQMRALRAAGARHYGYGPDDFLGRRPDARAMAVALNEHTIAASGR